MWVLFLQLFGLVCPNSGHILFSVIFYLDRALIILISPVTLFQKADTFVFPWKCLLWSFFSSFCLEYWSCLSTSCHFLLRKSDGHLIKLAIHLCDAVNAELCRQRLVYSEVTSSEFGFASENDYSVESV